MNWLIKLIFTALSEILIAAVQFLAGIINNVFDFMYELNLALPFDMVCNYTLGMGLSLVALFAVKQGIDVYVLHTDGDPDTDPLEIVTRLIVTVTTILCGQWGITYLIRIASQLAKEVVATVEYKQRTAAEIFTDAFMKFLSMGTILAVIQMIFFAVILVGFIIFIFKAGRRGAELMLFQVFMPLLSLDLLTTSKEHWNAYKMELLLCIFGYIVQLLCFNVFMNLFSQVMTTDGLGSNPKILFAAGAWLSLVLGAPKWLQKFLHKTGVGDALKGGARTATALVPQLLRR